MDAVSDIDSHTYSYSDSHANENPYCDGYAFTDGDGDTHAYGYQYADVDIHSYGYQYVDADCD